MEASLAGCSDALPLRIAGAAIGAWLVVGGAAAYTVREAPKAPEIVLAASFEQALNAGRLDEALALIAEDGTVKDLTGASITGREPIRAWLQEAIARHYHADAGIRQLSDGGRVTWTASLADDALRALNAAPVAAFVEAIVVDGRIRSWVPRVMAGDRLRIQAAMAKANEGVAREWIGSVRGQGGLEAIERLCASGFVDHNAAAGAAATRAALKARVAAVRSAFSGQTMSIEDVVVAADRVVIRGTVAGNQTAPLPGLPATGRSFNVGYIDILRLQDGLVVEHWGQVDSATMQQQLAPAPAPSATTVAPRPAAKPPDKPKSWF